MNLSVSSLMSSQTKLINLKPKPTQVLSLKKKDQMAQMFFSRIHKIHVKILSLSCHSPVLAVPLRHETNNHVLCSIYLPAHSSLWNNVYHPPLERSKVLLVKFVLLHPSIPYSGTAGYSLVLRVIMISTVPALATMTALTVIDSYCLPQQMGVLSHFIFCNN